MHFLSALIDLPFLQVCNVCKEQFESKTKLFAHINDTGHALASASAKDNESDRTKKGRKGKR
jgi:DnaJ family protein A protein 5